MRPAATPPSPPASGAASALAAALPAPFARWVTELLGRLPAAEPRATCHACAMCAGPADGAAPTARLLFDPQVRCCTYQPHMPNFLAGAVLGSDTADLAQGRSSLQRRIDEGDATPLGVRVSPTYQHLYRSAAETSFGRALALRCPHHRNDGGCGVWSHRPAVCATWFCKHERGRVGAAQWQALLRWLAAAERIVSLWCLRQLGLGAAQQADALAAHDDAPRLEPAALDRRSDARAQAQAWGDWSGREAAFYAACAERVATLDLQALLDIGGAEFALLADGVRDAVARHDDLTLPERVRTGSFRVCGSAPGQVWLQGHSAYDPLAVAPQLLTLVAQCDGRRWTDVAAAHARAHEARPSRWLLRTLLDFGVVDAADEADA